MGVLKLGRWGPPRNSILAHFLALHSNACSYFNGKVVQLIELCACSMNAFNLVFTGAGVK